MYNLQCRVTVIIDVHFKKNSTTFNVANVQELFYPLKFVEFYMCVLLMIRLSDRWSKFVIFTRIIAVNDFYDHSTKATVESKECTEKCAKLAL